MARWSSLCIAPTVARMAGSAMVGVACGDAACAVSAASDSAARGRERRASMRILGVLAARGWGGKQLDQPSAALAGGGAFVAALVEERLDGAEAIERVVGRRIDAAAVRAEQHEVALTLVGGEDLAHARRGGAVG